MATELEDQRELATSRLTELEKLQQDHQEAVKEIETLKMDVSDCPCQCKSLIDSCTELKQSLLIFCSNIIVQTRQAFRVC